MERFRRSLKTALITRHNTTDWVDDLPLILLSLRNTLKEDLDCSAAEFVFGAPLPLPGKYFSPTIVPTLTTSFVQELRQTMANLSYTPPWHRPTNIYVPNQQRYCTFVFMRNDAVKRPLTPTNLGPFQVSDRSDKHLTIKRGGCTDSVSVVRVKSTFLEKKEICSRWRVTFPKNCLSYI